MKKLAILLPAYNEELTISDTIDDFYNVLKQDNNNYDFKIYVYDNHSTDKTAQIVKQKQSKNNKIIYVYENTQGKGATIRKMFRKIDADIYVMADADMTYPAKHIFSLTQKIENGYDMAIGDRLTTTYSKENKRKFHNFGNNLVKGLINKLFKSNVNDIMTGYRAFSKQFIKTFPAISNGFSVETEMTIFALQNNLSIASVPVEYKDRPDGSESKLNTFTDGINVIKTIFNLLKQNKPLFFFSIIGAILFIIGFVPFVYVCIQFWQTGKVDKIPTLICSCFAFLGSLLMFFTGLILDSGKNNHRENVEIAIKNIK
jgi:glycosyltransferase involved in cell wall biosynthesis